MLSLKVIAIHVKDEGKKVVVAYVSCSNNNVESKYNTYKGMPYNNMGCNTF
jgi:hypothetical protein